MLSKVSPIMPLSTNIVEQLRKIDDFYVCTRFTEDMIGPPMVSIGNELYFRFMNFIYLPQPPESLTPEQVKKICDVRLEYFDELVNYQLNSSVVDTITDCVVANYSNPVPSLKALDFGCGSGLSSQMLLNRMPDLDLIGVDISEKAISRCQEQNKNIRARLTALGEPLPFETAVFDLIFAVFVMHFNIDMQTLGELYRVLRPSGLFVFNVYQRDIDGLVAQLDEVGFCSIDIWQRLSKIGNNHVIMSCRASP
jgi:SAM-dependent methyltransferase